LAVPTTWLEIVDTAVKIGLGAVVTGIATHVNNGRSHAKTVEKERHAKNVEMLESVTFSIEEATHLLLKHWAHIIDWARIKDRGDAPSEEKVKLIGEYRLELFTLFKGLTNSEGRLLLMGHNNQQQLLREYGQLISDYYRFAHVSNDQVTVAELDGWRKKIIDSRLKLYSALNTAYRAEG
jgi:hypothetical protein